MLRAAMNSGKKFPATSLRNNSGLPQPPRKEPPSEIPPKELTPDELLQKEMLSLYDLVANLLGTTTISDQDRFLIEIHCQQIKHFISIGANPNFKTQFDFTPLHLAALVGNLDLLEFLLTNKEVNFDASNEEGQTALHLVVVYNRVLPTLMVLRAFKDNSASEEQFLKKVNKKNEQGCIAMDYAGGVRSDSRMLYILTDYGSESRFVEQDIKDYREKKGVFEIISINNPAYFKEIGKYIDYLAKHRASDSIDCGIQRLISILDIAGFPHDPDPLKKKIYSRLIESLIVDLEELSSTPELAGRIFYRSLEIADRMKNSANNLKSSSFQMSEDYSEQWQKSMKFSASYLLNLSSRVQEKMTEVSPLSIATVANLISWLEGKETEKNKSSAKKKTPPPVEEVVAKVVVEKSPAEELRDVMSNMQKSASRGEKDRYPEESRLKLLGLFARSGESFDFKTTKDWTALHIAARLGNTELVSNLISRGANINLKTADGFSVLGCAAEGESRECLRRILEEKQLDLEEVGNVLKKGIKSRNKTLVSDVLESKSLVKKVAEIDKKDREKLLQDWRNFNNTNRSLATEDFRKKIADFENEIISLNKVPVAKEAAKEETSEVTTISKKERERIRKAENKIKEQERLEQEKIKSEQREREALEREKFQQEELWSRQREELEKAQLKGANDSKKQESETIGFFSVNAADSLEYLTDDSSEESQKSSGFQEQNSSPVTTISKLSADAPEFVPQLILEEKKQVQNFLRGKRIVKSVADLPQFLQPKIFDFLANNCFVLLKGSAVYKKNEISKDPSDLDVELLVPGIRDWNDSKVVDFVQHNFGVQISPEQIYRGPNRDGSIFTVNFKDENIALDVSIYDRNKKFLPPSFLGWTNSRERKIFFEKNGEARVVLQRGLKDKIFEINQQGFVFDYKKDFFINPEARGLITRLCFCQTIGLVKRQELENSLPQIFPNNPADLVFRELKLDRVFKAAEQEKTIREKISDFTKSHNFDEKLQRDFLKNLQHVMSLQVNLQFDPKLNPNYQVLFETLDKMNREIVSSPAKGLNPNYVQSLSKKNDTEITGENTRT